MCGGKERIWTHILCECEVLASRRYAYLASSLEPEEIKSIRLGITWNFSKVTGLPLFGMGHKGPLTKA